MKTRLVDHANAVAVGMPASYQKREPIRYLLLDLLWRPTKGILRFILVESSRGRMILISSDLKLDAITAVDLYSRRVTIETMFDTLNQEHARRYGLSLLVAIPQPRIPPAAKEGPSRAPFVRSAANPKHPGRH